MPKLRHFRHPFYPGIRRMTRKSFIVTPHREPSGRIVVTLNDGATGQRVFAVSDLLSAARRLAGGDDSCVLWKVISGTDGAYEISTEGVVKRTFDGSEVQPTRIGSRGKNRNGRGVTIRFNGHMQKLLVKHLMVKEFAGVVVGPEGRIIPEDGNEMNCNIMNLSIVESV